MLGPQRRPTLDAVGLDGPVATITAGWQEREPDDAELDALLDGRSLNLALYARWQDVLDRDPEYAEAERAHRAALAEQQELHLVQLDGVLGALREVARRGGSGPRVRDEARADAESVVRLVDDRHLARVAHERAAFADRWRPAEREAVARHRDAVAAAVAGAAALAVAGGHVGVLGHVLRLFGVGRPPTVVCLVGRGDGDDRPRAALPRPHGERAVARGVRRRGAGLDPRRGAAAARPPAGCASTTPLGWPSWPCGRRPPAA